MKLPPGSHSWASSKSIGGYFSKLLDSTDWMLRRVETIHLLDIERIERRVSLDIDLGLVREIAKRNGVGIVRARSLIVPVAEFKKGLQLDLDVRASNGDVIQVLTSDQDSRASQAVLLSRLVDAFKTVSDTTETPISLLPTSVLDDIFEIAKEEQFQRYLAVLEGLKTSNGRDGIDAVRFNGWKSLASADPFDDLLLNLAASYLLLVRVPATGDVTTIKFRYVDASDEWRPSRLARLGLVDPDFGIMISEGAGQRQHVRLVAPSGMEVDSALLEDVWTLSEEDEDSFPLRITPERAALYRSHKRVSEERDSPPRRHVAKSSLRLFASMTPKLGGFHVPAVGSVGFTLALVAFALVLEITSYALSRLTDTDAAVTILALVPSILSVYVARADEHAYVSQLLSIPRSAVFLTAVLTVMSAGVVAINADRGWVLLSLAITVVFTALVFIALMYTTVRVWRKQRRVRANSHITQQPGDDRGAFAI